MTEYKVTLDPHESYAASPVEVAARLLLRSGYDVAFSSDTLSIHKKIDDRTARTLSLNGLTLTEVRKAA